MTELFHRMSRLYCFYRACIEKGENAEVYRALADGAHAQMMNVYQYLHENDSVDSILNEIKIDIEVFLFTAEIEAKKMGREAEKLASRTRDAAKMAYMIMEQDHAKKTPVRNAYACDVCGWTGIDIIPEKCPLCGKKLL